MRTIVSKPLFFTKAFCLAAILFVSMPSKKVVGQCYINLLSGSNIQTVCGNTSIDPIFYTLDFDELVTGVTGLPPGVSYNTTSFPFPGLHIKGQPTSDGIYNYTVSTNCNPNAATGTITVLPNIPITWSSGSTNQIVCENNPITNIVYSCTGATVTGLPTGVTGSFNVSDEDFTISGTPTSAGVYNYTVSSSGCSSGSATGTITVGISPNLTVTSNVVCNGSSTGGAQAAPSGGIIPYTYSWSTGDQTSSISGKPAGDYTVTIIDATGCSVTASTIITQPNPLTLISQYPAITLTNNQNNPTPTNYQQMITLNSSNYTPYESAGLQNVEFTTGPNATGTVLQAWIESGDTNTSTSTVYWVNLGSNLIPANGSLTIYMNFMPSNVMSASGPTGEAPQLSTTYGQYDNGADVFNYYTNFSGTSLPANWSSSNQGLSVNNGLTMTNAPQVNVGGYVGYNVAQNLPFIEDTYFSSYMTGTGVNGGYGESWWGAGSGGLSNPFSGSSWVTLYLNNGANANGGWTVRDNSDNTYAVTNPPIGLVTEAYTSSSMALSYNYVNAYTDNFALTGPFYIGGQRQYNAPSAGNWTMNYTRLRTYPPGGIAPSISFNWAPPVEVIVTNATCSNNGSAIIAPIGGTTPYTYTWVNSNSTVVSTSNPTGSTLTGDTYTVTVQDNCGASVSASVTITAPSALLPNITVTNNLTCNNGSNGSATTSPSGGTSPYTYTWSDANTTTTASVSNLSAGTYSVTVQDANGCSAIGSISITQPAAINPNLSSTNVTCNGGSNGSVTANPGGGASPYSYLWSDANTSSTATVSNLTYGTYTVNVTDANNCSASASLFVSQPATLIYISAGTVSNVSCNGGSNGVVASTPVGGNPPFTYSWSNGTTTVSTLQTATGLSAGSYTVSVTDNCNVTKTASASITQPTAMLDTVKTLVNTNCNGGDGGSITLGCTGGTYPYHYLWSNGSTVVTASGLSAGTYSVIVTDLNGCTNTVGGMTITQPNAITETLASITYPLCNGEKGSATISVTGGTSPYSYTWTSGYSTTATATAIPWGSYTVTVKDANHCSSSFSFTMTQPGAVRDSSVAAARVNITCAGNNNGSITIGVKYGTPPYTYSWTPNVSSTNTVSGLSAGTYSVSVMDSHGCSGNTVVTSITQPAVLQDSVSLLANENCNGGNAGQISLGVRGGTTPYTYAWSNGNTTYHLSGLTAGTYSVTLTDHNGCSNQVTGILVSQPAPITSNITTNCIGNSQGTATISVSGGTPGYNYAWTGGRTGTSITVPNGTYTVTVRDAHGCSATNSVTVSCPAGPVVNDELDPTHNNTCCAGQEDITVYPNPNSGQFTIQWAEASIQWSVEIYNVLGQKVYSQPTIHEPQSTINISNQPNGIYLIRILDKDGNPVSQKKVIKTQ